MSAKKGKSFSEKHGSNLKPDPIIEKEMKKRSADLEISCALAFEIAKDLGMTPEEVGRTADLMNVSVVKCQLGLFGYKPHKKIVKAEDTSDQSLKDAVIESTENNRLSCKNAWKIAGQFNVSKLTLGNVSQANGIKIKSCQLGAF